MESKKTQSKEKSILSFLIKLIFPHKYKFILMSICVIILANLSVYWIKIFQNIFEILTQNPIQIEKLYWEFGLSFGILILIFSLATANNKLTQNLGHTIIYELRIQVFEHLQKLPAAFYYKNSISQILLRFTTDVYAIQKLLVKILPQIIASSLVVVFAFINILLINLTVSVFSLLSISLVVIIPSLYSKKSEWAVRKVKDQEIVSHAELEENIYFWKNIKLLGLSKHFKDQYDKSLVQLKQKLKYSGFFSNLVTDLLSFTENIVQSIIIGVSAFLVIHKIVSLAEVFACWALSSLLLKHLSLIMSNLPRFIDAKAAIFFLKKILDHPIENQNYDTKLKKDLNNLECIDLDHISFQYENSHFKLENLNLHFQKNQITALYGSSGSGKSTLLKILIGLDQAHSGKVLYKHQNHTIQSAILDKIAIVNFENELFNRSILENIQFGNLNCDMDTVIKVAQKVRAHESILKLNNQYDHIVGPKGQNITSILRQKIILARAMLKSPEILILDDATLPFDTLTEKHILNEIYALKENCIIIHVTQNLDYILESDYVYVLDKGKIIEHGNAKALIKEKGYLNQKYQKQAGFTLKDQDNEATISAERLQQIPIFSHLSLENCEVLSQEFRCQAYKNSEIIFHEGDLGNIFYVIAKGSLEVVKNLGTSQEKSLAFLETGDFFGEMALIEDSSRNASIRCKSNTLCLILSQKKFEALLDRDSDIRAKIHTEIKKRKQ